MFDVGRGKGREAEQPYNGFSRATPRRGVVYFSHARKIQSKPYFGVDQRVYHMQT